MKKTSQSGMITLEACISVLVFLILMLFFSGFFQMFMAQNATSHAIMQTSQSLSLDPYHTQRMIMDKNDDESALTVAGLVRGLITSLYGKAEKNPNYVTDDYWFASTAKEGDVETAVKNRFLGYLAGGDKDKADEMLKNMRVVDGFDGLDFSESYVENNTLYIVLRYEVEYNFDIWGMGTVEVEQTACSKIWK